MASASSSAFSAVRASPSLRAARKSIASSSIGVVASALARRSISTISSSLSACSAYTRVRESSAPLTSNAGFSVVAPISVTRPSSTAGSSASCWALLKRWISSRKNTVGPARPARPWTPLAPGVVGRYPPAVGRALEHGAHLGAAGLHGAQLLERRI